MNPTASHSCGRTPSFPRVSGDEPGAKAVMAVMDQFVPA